VNLRAALIALGLAASAGLVALALYTERNRSLQALGDLESCLFGEPLAGAELASERYRALELGSPPVRSRLSMDPVTKRIALVPEAPIPVELDWPGRCATIALPMVSAPPYRGLSRALVAEATPLYDALSRGERPANLDAFWSLVQSEAAARPRGVAAGPSWAPARVALHGANESHALPCPTHALASTEGGAGTVRFGDCEVIEEGGDSLVRVRALPSGGKVPPSSGFVGRVGGFEVPGGRGVLRGPDLLWIESGALHHRRVAAGAAVGEPRELAKASRFETCLSEGRRHVLAYGATSASAAGALAASVVLLDERGASTTMAIESAVPHFAGRVETAVTHSRPRLSCGVEGARVAFAWSTWVDQKVLHQVELWRCDEKSCARSQQRIELSTLQSSGCGFCSPALEPASVDSPDVIDLGEAVLLAWSTGRDERVRIAPLHELGAADDVVLVAAIEDDLGSTRTATSTPRNAPPWSA
jgi:hypothetical protein